MLRSERFRYAYIICDAGYLRWRRTQCGLALPTTDDECAYNEMFVLPPQAVPTEVVLYQQQQQRAAAGAE